MSADFPRASRAVSITASSALAAIALAGCGGSGPRLDHADAATLVSLAHRIAAEGACAQARDIPLLRRRAISLVNAHRVPAALQEPLLSGVAALAEQTPVCLPHVPAAATTTTTPPSPKPQPPGNPKPRGHDHDHGRGPGHGHGHGKR